MTTVADVEASGTSRAEAPDPQRVLYGLSWSGDTAQSSPEGLLRSPGCQGERKEGGADRMHAQADQHSQHHDPAAPKMGCQPVRSQLLERQLAPPSPREPLQSQQTGERIGSMPSAAV